MKQSPTPLGQTCVNTFDAFVNLADYSLMDKLHADPDANCDGNNHHPRQVFSGHFVPVTPTPLPEPAYVTHSRAFFDELGLNHALVVDQAFSRIFTGDMAAATTPLRPFGWATGYALSIYGHEYTQQCPFGTGNGYGDGRAISVFEGVINGKRWEMQLKGAGPTPYCRGGDGRAVLRSSVREFLAQDYMHALGVATSRSFTLYTSKTESVNRPWYSPGAQSSDPNIVLENPVAIATRVAPSFLRVGQLELFARRVRQQAHPLALEELRMIVAHVMEREYPKDIDPALSFAEQVVQLAVLFRQRLILLVANWLRVGYCQGNFNSDNCAVGGFTLDYGPFGFCELFDPAFQPWTGGGEHFALFNQPAAAETNYHMFYSALRPLLADDATARAHLDRVRQDFASAMQSEIQTMWALKLGLVDPHPELVSELIQLMQRAKIDFTLFFRELSYLPADITPLKKSCYAPTSPQVDQQWQAWLSRWHALIAKQGDTAATAKKMRQTNPKYAWREWLVAPAYQQAMTGDYSLIKELQAVFSHPYDEQSTATENKYYRLKPQEYFNIGGISHYSCSS